MKDTMTKEEMIQEARYNRGNQYTTDELFEEGNYVYVARTGYLMWENGEEVMDEDDELPEDGWWECTDYNENDPGDYGLFYDEALYDENDDIY